MDVEEMEWKDLEVWRRGYRRDLVEGFRGMEERL